MVAHAQRSSTLWLRSPAERTRCPLRNVWLSSTTTAVSASGDLAWLGATVDKHYAGDDSDLQVLVGAILQATAGMSVDDDTGRGDTPSDKGVEKVLAHPESDGITVVSVKRDWKKIFATSGLTNKGLPRLKSAGETFCPVRTVVREGGLEPPRPYGH